MNLEQTYLATVKQRQDEYKASQSKTTETPTQAGFNF